MSPCSVVIASAPLQLAPVHKACSEYPKLGWTPNVPALIQFGLEDPNGIEPADRAAEIRPPLQPNAVKLRRIHSEPFGPGIDVWDDYGSLNILIGDKVYFLTLDFSREATDADRQAAGVVVASITSAIGSSGAVPAPTRSGVSTGAHGIPLPFRSFSVMAVDGAHRRVFVSGGQGTSSLAAFDYDGHLVQQIPFPQGAFGMQLVGHDLFVLTDTPPASIAVIDTDSAPLAVSRTITVPGLMMSNQMAYAGGRLWAARQTGTCIVTLTWIQPDGSVAPPPSDSACPPQMWTTDTVVRSSAGDMVAAFDTQASPMALRLYDVGREGQLTNGRRIPAVGDVNGGLDAVLTPDGKSIVVAANPPSPGGTEGFRQFALDGTLLRTYLADVNPDAVSATSANGGMIAGGAENQGGMDLWTYRVGRIEPFWKYDFGGSITTANGGVAWADDGSRLFALALDPNQVPAVRPPLLFILTPVAAPAP